MRKNKTSLKSKYSDARAKHPKRSFMHHMLDIIGELKRLDRVRTSETYMSALNSFMRFRQGRDIMLNRFTPEIAIRYEAWLKSGNVSMNTISFYMRILRAAYNRAVEKGLTKQQYPFKSVYTGIGKTVKRAVSLREIRRIKELDLSSRPALDFARDMFLFSFYTRGMSFIDMAYLKKEDLNNGTLSYRRHKTGQVLYVKWEKCMQHIINKYPENMSSYLLPIIHHDEGARRQYQNAMRLVNNKLKHVAVLAGMPAHLTMYVSRHSWASIAYAKHIPLSVISGGMGHENEATTQIYLASLDTSAIDNANELILRGL